MKPLVIFIALLMPSITMHAQSAKQRKALLEQIIKLQVYLGYVKKGYNILDKGLSTIGSIKNGDWSLHKAFLDKRKNVSPKVKNYARIAAMVGGQMQLSRRYANWKQQLLPFNKISSSEKTFYRQVLDQILEKTITILQELQQIVTDGNYEMNDPERIARIEQLYALHTAAATSFHSFCDKTISTVQLRYQNAAELSALQQQY